MGPCRAHTYIIIIRTVSVMSQHLTEPLDATENSLSPSGDNDSPLILQERSKTNHESVQSRKEHTEKKNILQKTWT